MYSLKDKKIKESLRHDLERTHGIMTSSETTNLDVYEKLAEHLDRLPAGFPRTDTGVEIRILRRLFSPREAEIAQQLTLRPESPGRIARRIGCDEGELADQLPAMSRKGLIFRVRKGDAFRYMAAQFVIGIWEYHVNALDPDLIRDVNEYLPHFFKRENQAETPQLRTIPVSRALPSEQTVMAYEQAKQMVIEQDNIVVAPCICRKEHLMSGTGCGKPLETCLVFGAGALYYEENGFGRPISREEALEILDRAERSGLVLQPSNAQKVVNICACCSCCCQILKNLKALPNPGRYVGSNFLARVDESLCTGCRTCVSLCPMDALQVGGAPQAGDTSESRGAKAVVIPERCIGCGVCVPPCPEQALSLFQKPEEERITPPPHLLDTLKKIHRERIAKRSGML